MYCPPKSAAGVSAIPLYFYDDHMYRLIGRIVVAALGNEDGANDGGGHHSIEPTRRNCNSCAGSADAIFHAFPGC